MVVSDGQFGVLVHGSLGEGVPLFFSFVVLLFPLRPRALERGEGRSWVLWSVVGMLLGASRPWPAFPLVAYVFVYFLSKTKLAGAIVGQCVLMFADAVVRSVASQLETD